MKNLLIIFLIVSSFTVYGQDQKTGEENLDKNSWTKFWDKVDQKYGWGNEVGKKNNQNKKEIDNNWWSNFWNKVDGILSTDKTTLQKKKVDDSPRDASFEKENIDNKNEKPLEETKAKKE